MADYQVTCTTKSTGGRYHEHITHIGGVGTSGWRLTKESAIRRIKTGTDTFFTVDNTTGRRVAIGVVEEAGKAPFLRTHADGKWNDNLLALPACPSSFGVIE